MTLSRGLYNNHMTFLGPPLLLLSLILRPIPAGFVSEYILNYVAHYGSSSICGCALVCFPGLQAVSACGWRSVPAFFFSSVLGYMVNSGTAGFYSQMH